MSGVAENIVVFATIVEAIVLAPILFEFVIERRKRRAQIELSLEILETSQIGDDLAGLDDMLAGIRDLVDRARHPEAYAKLRAGNEILIAGPPLSGKKALAKRIACDVGIQKIIIVHNPRNADALAKAKSLITRNGRTKIMLLLPRLDLIDGRGGEESLVELDALIEVAGERSHVLVVGTTSHHRSGSEIDNLFGTILVLPGTELAIRAQPLLSDEVRRMLAEVTAHYLRRAQEAGYVLADMTPEAFVTRILQSAINPAEIEDILAHCQTAALYRQRKNISGVCAITLEILEISIQRVVIHAG